MTTNEEKLKESLETRRPVLFLGAGFSLKATSGSGCPLMVGSDLAKGLYNYVNKSSKMPWQRTVQIQKLLKVFNQTQNAED